jgi:membrane-associated phospholipid phosphatase
VERGAVWAVAIPLILFKVWFAILLLTYAPTQEGITWIVATHWPLVIVVGLLIAGPGWAWYRLARVRARREQLRRAEWMLDPSQPIQRTAPSANAQPQWSLWETVSRLERDD